MTSSPTSHAALAAGDGDPSAWRGRQRLRRAAWSTAASFVARGFGMLTMVLGVSLTTPYLGAERLGLWMTVASFSAMLTFLDLGTGHALVSHVARQAAADQVAPLARSISGGLGAAALLALLVGLGLAALAATLPWGRVLNGASPALAAEARGAALAFALLFGLFLMGSAVHKVYAGLQRGFESQVASALAALLSLAALGWAASRQAGVAQLLGATMGAHALSAWPLLWRLHREGLFRLRWMRESWSGEGRSLLRLGSLFLLLQLGAMVGWGSDSLIVATLLGTAQAGEYGLAQRLMQLVAVPLSLMIAPLWAAYADAHARGDHRFVAQTLRRSLGLSLGLGLCGVLVLALLADALVARWTGGRLHLPPGFVWVFGLWTVIEAAGGAFGVFLNGCGVVRPQLWVVGVFCALVIPLKVWLAAALGLHGVVLATVVSYLVAVPLMYATVFRAQVSAALGRREAA